MPRRNINPADLDLGRVTVVSRELGEFCSPRLLRDLIYRGEIRGYKFGAQLLVDRNEVRAYLRVVPARGRSNE